MNRPKKSKNDNPLLPKDQQVDERHLVDTEESSEISFEDRINIYWMENKGFIIGCIAFLALAIIGFQGMRLYKDQAVAGLQEAYQTAKANDALEAFAREHAKRELGGLAALESADAAYRESDYARALELYTLAAGALEDTLLAGRARLGAAFARFFEGEAEAAFSELNALAADTSLPEAIRSEAAYHLAIEADMAGRPEAFKSYAEQIESAQLASGWKQRLEEYRRQMR